jgi:hypothetical protein
MSILVSNMGYPDMLFLIILILSTDQTVNFQFFFGISQVELPSYSTFSNHCNHSLLNIEIAMLQVGKHRFSGSIKGIE